MNIFGTEDRPQSEEDWFVSAFGPLYPIIYAHRDEKAAANEASVAAALLQLGPADAALDLCCGSGRHLAVLSRHTASLVGLDYSSELLARIPESVRFRAALVRADMRAIPFENAFDAVCSFFTSFGYFPDDEDNCAAAAAMAGSMRPNARFFMDYLNPAGLSEGLQPETERFWEDYRIRERRWIDTARRRVNKVTSVWRHDRPIGETRESVRLYEANELEALLRNVGLKVLDWHGDYAGAPYDRRSPRMLLTGKKVR